MLSSGHGRHPHPRDRSTPPETSEAIAGRLRLSATRLARRLRQQADTGLSPSQLSALAVVERHGPVDPRRARRARAGRPAERHPRRRQARGRRLPHPPARPGRPARHAGRRSRRRVANAPGRVAPPEDRMAHDAGSRAWTRTSARASPTRSTSSTRSRRSPDEAQAPPRRHGHVPVAARPQLPPVLRRPADLPDRQLADDGGADAARPEAHRRRRRHRVPRRRAVRPGAADRRVGRAHRRPLGQAQAADHRAVDRDGAVLRARRARVQREPAALVDLRGRARRWHHRGVRQPGPARVRGRDGPRRGHEQRGQPQQRGDDLVADLRPRARRPAGRSRSASAGRSWSTASPTSPCSSASR